MTAAMEPVTDGTTVSINQAAREYGVPASTLKDRLSCRVVHGTKPGPVSYLNAEEEADLAVYIEKVTIERGILCSSLVSDGWWKRFLERHPRISLRSGDATAHAGFVYGCVTTGFTNLSATSPRESLSPMLLTLSSSKSPPLVSTPLPSKSSPAPLVCIPLTLSLSKSSPAPLISTPLTPSSNKSTPAPLVPTPPTPSSNPTPSKHLQPL